MKPKIPIILMADDDKGDQLLFKKAIQQAHGDCRFLTVKDGEQLMCYLRREREYVDANQYPLPHIILLDLNMPRLNGYQCLIQIKAEPSFASIPIVILTTSSREEDVLAAYSFGANSYIQKPFSYDEIVEAVSSFSDFWLQSAELPYNYG